MSRRPKPALDPVRAEFLAGWTLVGAHPLFRYVAGRGRPQRHEGNPCPAKVWMLATAQGTLWFHHKRRAAPDEWARVIGHGLTHLGLGHFQERPDAAAWNAACCVAVERLLTALKFGRPPGDWVIPEDPGGQDEERLYEAFVRQGPPPGFTLDLLIERAGAAKDEDVWTPSRRSSFYQPPRWPELFALGLVDAVTSAVNVAAGVEPRLGSAVEPSSVARRARDWFINSYPLLGALAASFTLIEDPLLCNRMGIGIGAVNPEQREIYLNPAAGLDEMELRFVLAHEMLHAGLRHDSRRQGRDPYLWNCAADYVINGWLVEMGVGSLPRGGLLYDPALAGESAESVYDRLVTDLRRSRRLLTLSGRAGLGDVLDRPDREWWCTGAGVELDDFYRRALAQGLSYHQDQGRGLLPASLVEEIRALAQPPPPWDVELARWFDERFPPMERRRSYARASRRQSATPDIPRPNLVLPEAALEGRTFGVVLDTSGSMDRSLLAKALGTIAGYAVARDVMAVRVVFCDAATYDQGYLPPEEIGGRVRVRGRGGTVLQPGIDLLEKAGDFPEDGPILIITDGWCDHLRVRRDHAFVLPRGRRLPFVARGPVFTVE